MPDRPLVHLHLSQHRRDLSLFVAGSSKVTAVRPALVSADRGTAHAQITHADAVRVLDALAEATGHYPATADAQRAHVEELGDELAARRRNGDDLAALAHARHVGHIVRLAADALYACRTELLADRTVALMFAELGGMVEAMLIGPALTSPEERIRAHYDQLQAAAAHLPPQGDPTS